MDDSGCSHVEVGRSRRLKDAEALPRADPDGENDGSADHGNPETALWQLVCCFG
jgi:hypothetical protein